MKKIITILISLILTLNIPVYAAVGDIAGDVYETDIKTYFFDYELNSYNIGGRTAIICEDLGWFFGFYVEWKEAERRLEMRDDYKNTAYIEDFSKMHQRNLSLHMSHRPKEYFDTPAPEHIYYTDIITTLSGREIVSYNVNGRTAIIVEDLRDFGYDVIWDADARTLNVYERFENIPVSCDIGQGYVNGGIQSDYNSTIAQNTQYVYRIWADGEAKEFNTFMANEYFYNMMYPLDEIFDFLNIKYSFENNILTIDTSEAKTITEIDYQENKVFHKDIDNSDIMYLYVDNVICNGKETQISYEYTSGHFQNMGTYRKECSPYLIDGTVYIPYSFISEIAKIPY